MNLYYRFAKWFFSAPAGDRSKWDIIVWWELRRIPYNIIVGTVGICSVLLLYFFIGDQPIQHGEDMPEPFGLLLAPFAINFCYTAGWIVEAFFPKLFLESFLVERKQLGPKFLRNGLWLSVFVVLLPAGVWGVFWIRYITGFGS